MRSLLGGLESEGRFPALSFLAVLLLASAASHAQIPGRNVNMVSGTGWPGGDPFLQRQNEPTLAVSTRNPMHLLAGANDYRTVDLPGLPDDRVTGDAWLGVFTSYDGGATWKSTLLPGYPQDAGSLSPLFGFEAAADPVVRAGTHGLFYYSGIAFDRSNPVIVTKGGDRPDTTALAGVGGASSAVFVARFIDNNNRENGEPIAHLGTAVVADNVADAAVFLDKPWLAVDMPRKKAGTCTITQTLEGETVSQTVPAGNVYVSWARFTGTTGGGDTEGRIYFSRSTDCGVTWSPPVELSGAHHINQGATIAIDPRTGTVYVAWRRFKYPLGSSTPTESDAILLTRSFDGGATFTAPEVVADFQPFDQGTAETRFRTNAYPAVAVDRHGRVFVLFSARGYQPDGDARIVLTQARFPSRAAAVFKDEDNGTENPGRHDPKASWSAPAPVDADLVRRGHQIMPTAIVTGDRLQIAYVDLQQDHTWAEWFRDAQGVWTETRVESAERANDPASVFRSDRIDDAAPPLVVRRHTADLWVAQATASDHPSFACRRASSYEAGVRLDAPQTIQQLRFNPPNLPLFKLGTAPFWGDYIDLGSVSFEQKNKKKWRHATKTDASYIAFTDNRDVRPPFDGRWDLYTPPTSTALGTTSLFDGVTPVDSCDPANPERAGMRNQNVYLSRVTQGLFVGVPGNAKPLGTIQRAFVVTVENQTFEVRTFRLTLTKPPGRAVASFRQFSVLTSVDVAIAPRSSISRTVFVQAADPKASVAVDVQETREGQVVPPDQGGLEGGAIINPEMVNPEMVNPEMVNPEMVNEDVLSVEVHTPEMVNPEMVNPEMVNPEMVNPEMVNPEMVNPEMVNPEMLNPEMVNPEMVNPEMVNPEMVNPEMVNTDLVNGSLTDTTWTITNLGNTTSAYDVRLLLRSTEVPEGFKTQLILHKTYTTPVAKACALREEAHNVLIASIPDPRLDPAGTNLPYDPADGSLQHATLWLAPGESARITLRVIDPDKTDDVTFEPFRDVTASVKPQAVDTDDAAGGVTDPPEATSSPLVFLQAPHATPVGGLVTPTVQVLVQDETGAPISGATVVLGLSWNPAGATLHNATATTSPLGVASFPDLWLDRVGSGYRLQAVVGAVSSSATAPFDVVPLVVTRTDDNDISVFPPEPTVPGSLRAALENANRNVAYRDQISFAIPGVGPHTITLTHQAPQVTDPAVIDGTTQPGYAGTPRVRVECPYAADCMHTLWVQANDTTIRGLALTGTAGAGILVTNATGALLEHNYVGTDGTSDLGNGRGIDIVGGGTHTVRANVISGNDGTGIDILDSSGSVIRDNRIGTNASGTAAIGNAQQGVRISGSSSNNLIGGPSAGNVISGNVEGIGIYGPAHDNTVEGNRVGTNASGDAAVPNRVAGLHISGAPGNTLIANLVSGNDGPGAATAVGVWLDSDATGNVVESNVIGLNAAQTAAMPNSGGGVSVHGTGTTANTLVANTISGNALQGVDFRFGTHDNALTDNHIGTDSSGTTAFGNAQNGIRVLDNAQSIAIGAAGHGNTISGNGADGVHLNATRENLILGNRIGTNSAGTSAIPNAGYGVNVAQSTLDRIGGAAAGEGNVISGNAGFGVYVVLSPGTTILGNRIGVDASASTAIPNGAAGIAANDINTLTIGGTTAGEGNVISGNTGDGVGISTCSSATVQRNFIGTNGTGLAAIPNGGHGVHLTVAFNVAIGGSAGGVGNVISGQDGDGVLLSNSQLNLVDGNRIGLNATGTGPLPNHGAGVRLDGGASDNVIGEDATGGGNAIAFNGGGGIVDEANPGTANFFGPNSVYSNTGLGIDLANDGVTPNDSADLDAGPNDLLNFPVLTSATAGASITQVAGTLNSIPGATFVIQLFSSASCDPSGYGEGEVFEESTTVATDAGGDAGFFVTIGQNLLGRYVTATTSTVLAGGATSEFSACIAVVPNP